MPTWFNALLLLVLLAQPITGLTAQRMLGLPEAYHPPENPYNSRLRNTFSTSASWNVRSKDFAWRIVIDRTGVSAMDQPGNGSRGKSLKFGDGYYVDDTEGEWLHLVETTVDGLRVPRGEQAVDVGWVHKDKVLLWYESLINPRTKIHLKALLINKLDNIGKIPCEDRELVRVYLDPNREVRADSSSIYNFYFVYKIENGRYLLGNEPKLNRVNPGGNLLGWVDQDRLAEWNTRVALEPNFTDAGFQERKANKQFQVLAFDDQFKATYYQKNADKGGEKEIWKRDPVWADRDELAPDDPLRFKADLMRYPLTNVDEGGAQLDYFRSAVCDQVLINMGCDAAGNTIFDAVGVNLAAEQREFLDKHQQAATNFNVFFVVEASSHMEGYKEAIGRLAGSIKRTITTRQNEPNIRFGALAYRDYTVSSNPDQLVTYQNLTASSSTFQRFLQQLDFALGGNNETLPVQNYGISQALNVAKFNPYHTNIMIVLGTKGDFTHSRLTARRAPPVLMPDRGTITTALNKYKVNLFGVQCVGGTLLPDREFSSNLVGTIQEAASKNYAENVRPDRLDPKVQKLLKENGYTPQPPAIKNPRDVSDVALTLLNGTVQGGVDRILTQDGRRTATGLEETVSGRVAAIIAEKIRLGEDIETWKTGAIAPKGFTSHMIEIIDGYTRNAGDNIDWSKQKYELYKEVYFPIQPAGAANPMFSYVLFWTRDDLKDYQRTLNGSLTDMGDAPRNDRREYLQQTYCDLLDRFTGGGAKECEEYTIDEIEKLVQGVKNEGVNFTGRKERIRDLTDQRAVSDARIEEIIAELNQVNNRLRRLLDTADGAFTFKRNKSEFYWVKVSDLYF